MKKINTHQKGTRIELEYRKMKEKEGWTCEIKNWSKFQKKDFFNLFDVMGFKENAYFFAQVKSNQSRGVAKKISEFKMPTGTIKILAIKKDYGKWREIIIPSI